MRRLAASSPPASSPQQPRVALGAARPTITASQPVVCSTASARGAAGDVARGDHRDVDQRRRARPSARGRPCRCTSAARSAGAASAPRARLDQARAGAQRVARAVALAAAHLHRHRHVDRVRRPPRRCAPPTSPPSAEQRAAGARLRHLACTGQPMLMSTMSAPAVDHHARGLGQQRRLRAEDLHRQRALVGARCAGSRACARCRSARPQAETISEHTSPAPKRRPWRRKACTETPAMGASTTRPGDLDGADRSRCRSRVRTATATPQGTQAGAVGRRCYGAAIPLAPRGVGCAAIPEDRGGEGSRPHP